MINVKTIKVRISNLDHITNCYIVYDEEKNAVIIDPGDEKEKILDFVNKNNLNIKYVFITHVHIDHILALPDIVKNSDIKIVTTKQDIDGFYDENLSCANILNIKLPKFGLKNLIEVENNQIIKCGKMEFEFIFTPGHTKGSMCIYEKNMNCLFSGDTIFSNCYGRCDLPGASIEDMKKSLNMIFSRFSDDTYIYPGHNDFARLKEAKKRINLLLALKG